jgi:protein-tyrosine phosphatase
MPLLPTIYEVLPIGSGQLSVMAKPVSGEWIAEEFAGLRELGVDHVVSLLEEVEQFDVGLADEEALCCRFGMCYTSFPIVDRDTPSTTEALGIAGSLHRNISDGEHVVIHCRAGIGRTGLMASAVLVQEGYSPAEAIHIVSFARGVLVPDTDEQDAWIRALLPQ